MRNMHKTKIEDRTSILKFQMYKRKKLNKKVKKFLTFLNSIGKPKGKRKEKERLRQCKKII